MPVGSRIIGPAPYASGTNWDPAPAVPLRPGGMGSGEIANRDLASSMDVSTGIATVLCIHHYLGLQEQPSIPQMVVGHNRIIPISLNAENCHFDEPLLGKNKCRFSWKMTKTATV